MTTVIHQNLITDQSQLHPQGDYFGGWRLPEYRLLYLGKDQIRHPLQIVGRSLACQIHGQVAESLSVANPELLPCQTLSSTWHKSFANLPFLIQRLCARHRHRRSMSGHRPPYLPEVTKLGLIQLEVAATMIARLRVGFIPDRLLGLISIQKVAEFSRQAPELLRDPDWLKEYQPREHGQATDYIIAKRFGLLGQLDLISRYPGLIQLLSVVVPPITEELRRAALALLDTVQEIHIASDAAFFLSGVLKNSRDTEAKLDYLTICRDRDTIAFYNQAVKSNTWRPKLRLVNSVASLRFTKQLYQPLHIPHPNADIWSRQGTIVHEQDYQYDPLLPAIDRLFQLHTDSQRAALACFVRESKSLRQQRLMTDDEFIAIGERFFGPVGQRGAFPTANYQGANPINALDAQLIDALALHSNWHLTLPSADLESPGPTIV